MKEVVESHVDRFAHREGALSAEAMRLLAANPGRLLAFDALHARKNMPVDYLYGAARAGV